MKEKVKKKVEQRAEKRAGDVTGKALDRVECVATDNACIEKARQSGKQVVLTDGSGRPLPADQQGGKAAPVSPNPGEGAWANYDFVPGERVLYREDFSSERVGNFPRRLEFVAGNAEVVAWSGGNWLRVADNAAIVAIPLPEVLPDRFTIEFQVTLRTTRRFPSSAPHPSRRSSPPGPVSMPAASPASGSARPGRRAPTTPPRAGRPTGAWSW